MRPFWLGFAYVPRVLVKMTEWKRPRGSGVGMGGSGSRVDVVSAPFPSWNRSILTEIYLCHACSYQEIEDGNGAPGQPAAGHPPLARCDDGEPGHLALPLPREPPHPRRDDGDVHRAGQTRLSFGGRACHCPAPVSASDPHGASLLPLIPAPPSPFIGAPCPLFASHGAPLTPVPGTALHGAPVLARWQGGGAGALDDGRRLPKPGVPLSVRFLGGGVRVENVCAAWVGLGPGVGSVCRGVCTAYGCGGDNGVDQTKRTGRDSPTFPYFPRSHDFPPHSRVWRSAAPG
jgi:hypothetical protein